MAGILEIIEPLSDTSLWALDETGKRLESNNFYSWSKIGQSPVIEHNADHTGANIIGATEILKDFRFLFDAYPVEVKFNSDDNENNTICASHVIKFISKVLEYDQLRGIKKTFIIMDNARIHTAQSVKDFAKEHNENLILIFQPKYSPQLNPQEQIWNWLKKEISKYLSYKSVTDLLNKIQNFQQYLCDNSNEVKHQVCAHNYYK